MGARDQQRHTAAAKDDTRRAIAAIIRRGGDADILAIEAFAAVEGRYDLTPKQPAEPRCEKHPDTKPNALGHCPICGPKGL